MLEDMRVPLIALFRGDDILMVGKFTPEVIQQVCKPGDKVVDEDGNVGTYCPPSSSSETPSSSSSEPAPEVPPVPQVPFTGKAHKL